MGLDMYAYAARREALTKLDDCTIVENATLIHQWRKHPDLHGWMEALYWRKGGDAKVFNCEPVELTSADLDALEAAIQEGKLPVTQGFFFGDSDGSEVDGDLDFVEKARDAISKGLAVFYTSWW